MSSWIFCVLPAIIAYIYVFVYCKTRNFPRRDHDLKVIYSKIGLCLCFDYLLMVMTAPIPEISYMLRMMLLEILSGIDIHIRKIPTEFLAAAGILSVIPSFRVSESVFAIFSAVLTGLCLYYFRKKIGIGSYDILLIVLLEAALPGMVMQLKFIALFLILWGIAGSIIGALKNRKDLSIPLVPLITFSYFAVQTIL